MAKVAILVPHREMCDLARRMVGQYANLTALCVEYVGMEDIPRRARELEAGGCELIVARGAHAHLVRDTVRLPLVELRTSAQELGRIVLGIPAGTGGGLSADWSHQLCQRHLRHPVFQRTLSD